MANRTDLALRGGCPAPFYSSTLFTDNGGYVDGRLCSPFGKLKCCMPCPLVDYVYPDAFGTLTTVANWISVVSASAALFLLLSWAFLPVDRTHRHYLSISLTTGVLLMNFGFVIPLAAQPQQCHDAITPNGQESSSVCAASGALLLLGGWTGIMWVFLRSISLHLQICWQINVGRKFMIYSHVAGWGIPFVALAVALIFTGVSFRFGATCHLNHTNSFAAFWIPLLVLAGFTVVVTFTTFGYCVKVYMDALADNSAAIEGSDLPTYQGNIKIMSSRQAYQRIRRVISLQWRGILIVLIIVADVVFFSVVFVSQDSIIKEAQVDATKARKWVLCLVVTEGNKTECLDEAEEFVMSMGAVVSVLLLLALNGVWLLFLLGRKDMVFAWFDFFKGPFLRRKEFVSVDARSEEPKDKRSYEMFFRDSTVAITPMTPVKSPNFTLSGAAGSADDFQRAPAYHYQPHDRSFSSPRPPRSAGSENDSEPPPPPPPRTPPPRTPSPIPESVSPMSTEPVSPISMEAPSMLTTWETRPDDEQPSPPEYRPWGMGMKAI